jgi:hypothetical protein
MDCYDQEIESIMLNYYLSLPEKAQRHYAAVEAAKLGHGGISYISDLFGCSRQTPETDFLI